MAERDTLFLVFLRHSVKRAPLLSPLSTRIDEKRQSAFVCQSVESPSGGPVEIGKCTGGCALACDLRRVFAVNEGNATVPTRQSLGLQLAGGGGSENQLGECPPARIPSNFNKVFVEVSFIVGNETFVPFTVKLTVRGNENEMEQVLSADHRSTCVNLPFVEIAGGNGSPDDLCSSRKI